MESPSNWTGWQEEDINYIVSTMGTVYRPPQYDADASRQTYLVQKLQPVKDPRTMPKVIGGPDWSPAASRVGKAFRVAAPHGATVRVGAALDSREVAVLARDALVEVIDATADERRVRVEAAGGEGWVSAKCLLPFSEAHIAKGCKVAPQAVPHADWVRAELGLDGAKDPRLDALKARPSSAQKIF